MSTNKWSHKIFRSIFDVAPGHGPTEVYDQIAEGSPDVGILNKTYFNSLIVWSLG